MTASEAISWKMGDKDKTRRGLSPISLIVLYVAIGLTPVALASVQDLPGRNFWREFSSALAMIAFAMLLMEFLSSGRARAVSGRAGIDLTMRFHQLATTAILVFIIAHPFLYAVPRLSPEPAQALASLRGMFTSTGLRTGVIAWFLMIVFVLMAVWRDRLPFRYEVWRASHGLGAALIAGFSAHHTLRVGTYSESFGLTGFWLVLTGIALATLLHVYLIKPVMQARRPYRVVANDRVADRMWRVALEPDSGHAIPFAGGQFAWVNLGHSSFSITEHPFSISSAPGARPRIEFTIKESGDFTSRVGTVEPGTVAYLDGPHGAFTHIAQEPGPVVFIAGGVGFAPIVGMMRQMRDEGWLHPVTLIYGNRAETQILYRDEIEAMANSPMQLDVHLVLSESPEGWTGATGELTREVLSGCLASVSSEATYYVCGPTPMMDAVEKSLVELGIAPSAIISERFKYD